MPLFGLSLECNCLDDDIDEHVQGVGSRGGVVRKCCKDDPAVETRPWDFTLFCWVPRFLYSTAIVFEFQVVLDAGILVKYSKHP